MLTSRLLLQTIPGTSIGTALPFEVKRLVVTGFSRYSDTDVGLPPKQREKLDRIAEWVVNMGQPGGWPIREITCIGHADRDAQRGPAYEKTVSEQRARKIMETLQARIEKLDTWPWGFRRPTPPVYSQIKFKPPYGVGAAVPHPDNKYKTVLADADRQKNRRVEILFEQSTTGTPVPPPFWLMEMTDQVMSWLKYKYPPPEEIKKWWKWPTPQTKDEWREFLRFLRSGTPFVRLDLKTALDGILQGRPEGHEEFLKQWAENFTDAWLDVEREMRKRTLDPPGDPDEPEDDYKPGIRYHYEKKREGY
jgi:hypothetical protein